MITFITDRRKRRDGTYERDILADVAHLPLTILAIDESPIAVMTSKTEWTHASLVALLPQLNENFAEQLSEGANAYLGDQFVGSTEI